jgi:hypothetical protein
MAPAQDSMDDVIRIRIDATRAVDAFLALLAEQAADGETVAPANPAATAIWRELAPFRLVEYGYVSEAVGPIIGAYIGFPDGRLHSVEDDIPEDAVTDMVQGNECRAVDLPPLYIYVVLDQPAGREAIDTFLVALSAQVGHALVGVVPGLDGKLKVRVYDADAVRGVAREAERHFGKAQLLERFSALTRRPDGRAYAVLTYAYAKCILEFPSAEQRDDFVAWSRALCDWLGARGDDPAELGFAEALRPAELAPIPEDDRPVARWVGPSSVEGNRAWTGITDAASPEERTAARAYWAALRQSLEH